MKNFVQKVLGEFGARLLMSLFVLWLARTVGTADFGRYSTALAFCSIFTILVDLGTSSILTREIARQRIGRERLIKSANGLKTIAAVITWGIIFSASHFFQTPKDKISLVSALGIVVIGYTLAEYYSSLLAGIEEMGWEAALKIMMRSIILSGGLIGLVQHKSISSIVSYMAYGTFVALLAGAVMVRWRIMSFGFSLEKTLLKQLGRYCFPVFGSTFFRILYDNQDMLLLNHFYVTDHEIGLFAAAMKVMDVLRAFPVLLTGAFFPSLAKIANDQPESFKRRVHSLMMYMFIGLVLLIPTIYMAAPTIISTLYGDKFLLAIPYLQLLLPVLFGISFNHIFQQLLIAQDCEGRLFTAAMVASLSNLFLGWLWIPRWGVHGVCYALIVSETLYFCYQLYQATQTNRGLLIMEFR